MTTAWTASSNRSFWRSFGRPRNASAFPDTEGIAVDHRVAADRVPETGDGAPRLRVDDAGDVGLGLEEVTVVADVVVQLPERGRVAGDEREGRCRTPVLRAREPKTARCAWLLLRGGAAAARVEG